MDAILLFYRDFDALLFAICDVSDVWMDAAIE